MVVRPPCKAPNSMRTSCTSLPTSTALRVLPPAHRVSPQTRGWFYTLMVLSTALFDKPAFKNLVSTGRGASLLRVVSCPAFSAALFDKQPACKDLDRLLPLHGPAVCC